MCERDTVQYRRLTDRPVSERGGSGDQPPSPSEHQLLPLARGNRAHLPQFAREGQNEEPEGKVEQAEGKPGKWGRLEC